MEKKLFYFPNPAHKKTTSEAGPPKWYPNKSACPDICIQDRDDLVAQSISLDGDLGPVRFAARRVNGSAEVFKTQLTREHADGRIEIHGYPLQDSSEIPSKAIRLLSQHFKFTESELRKWKR